MSSSVPRRGNQGGHCARPEGPLSGRRGAYVEKVTRFRVERPVDTIAVARKPAEE